MAGDGDRPTRNLRQPFGCITPGDLRTLADAVEKLEIWHSAFRGRPADHPCLRRIEAIGDRIEAHISTGPAVGGAWFTFALTPNGWKLMEDHND